ncbi:MAG: hypothetical protein JJLCMIEE_00338 [Acidimicrobiales bacterium]|nr:hypothetical protein [Acidimicrobiales bacterium]RIK04094.1 MAG: hypothetical protein DCC48_14340 [Acidobacteriota bacterium]
MADSTNEIWRRVARPYVLHEVVDALLGLSPSVVRQLAGTLLATSDEAVRLLDEMPRTIRSLSITMTTRPQRCQGELRGPVLWSETMSARASSYGLDDVLVCAAPSRGYDIVENRLLVMALLSVRDAGRAADAIPAADYDDETLRAARLNGFRAQRYLEHRSLASVPRERPAARDLKRALSGRRSRTYHPAFEMLDRSVEPLRGPDLLPFCDHRTKSQHNVVLAVAESLERRGIDIPAFRAIDGALEAGPIRYIHPRVRGDHSRLHGILVGDVLLDVPEKAHARSPSRAEAALAARASGRPHALVTSRRDVEAAVELAIQGATHAG